MVVMTFNKRCLGVRLAQDKKMTSNGLSYPYSIKIARPRANEEVLEYTDFSKILYTDDERMGNNVEES